MPVLSLTSISPPAPTDHKLGVVDPGETEIANLRRELAALREREQDLLDFVENGSLALHWVNVDGLVVWVNQAELDLLGYTREEYIGHPIAEFHADQPVIDDILSRLKDGETLHNYEARLRTKSGEIRHVLISSSVRFEGDRFIHTRCFTRDITERKRFEQRLMAQYAVGQVLAGADSLEAAAPALLEAVAAPLDWCVGIFWTPAQSGEFLRCAAHWERGCSTAGGGFAAACGDFTFAPGAGLPGRVWSAKAPSWIEDLRADPNFPRLELAARHGLRSAFALPVFLAARFHGVMEFLATETRSVDDDLLKMAESLGHQIGEFVERTSAQQRVAEREESYRVLTETVTDGILTVDASHRILFANAAAGRIFGYSPEELAGLDLSLLMPDSQRARHQAAMAQYLETGQRHMAWDSFRTTGRHRAGYDIPIELSLGEYRRQDQRLFVAILRDITDRTRMDEALRQTTKLESLGILAGGIAHDFNNLLTGVMGNISLALDTIPDSNPAKPNLQDAVEATERAAILTRQLLAYAGKGRFLIQPTDISGLVREISSLVRRSIPSHVALRLDLADSLPKVEADVAQLQQLLMNLVINGAEAIPEGRQGTVLVITRLQHMDAEQIASLGVSEIVPGDYVAINVHDNGVGMDEATLSRIFDPFFTTKFTGRGLGLAAAGGIVRGHKGGLKVFSSPGQGTTFRVLLPAAATARDSVQAPAAARDGLGGRGMILLVDDEPIVRRVATSALTRYGYTVVSSDNGREGVERFRELHTRLKLVILDMTMPVMSGEEALDRLREIDPEIPVILSSGYSEMEATRRFAGRELAGFLQKPYTAAQLAAKVQSVLQESRGIATP
jgi:PAS domain S-box-containing protein